MFQLVFQIIEFLLSVGLCLFIKVGREETKMSGRVLKFAYRVEKNLLYNYEFGKYTKVFRFCLIPFLLSTLFRKVTKLKSSFNFYQIMLFVVDLLSLTDCINTTESYQRYCLVYAIRIIRTSIMLIDLVRDVAKLVMGHFDQRLQSKQIEIQQQLQQNQQEQAKQQESLSDESDQDEQQKLINTKKQQQQQTMIKRLIFPQMKIPCIALNLIINQQQYYIQIIDPWSFDNSFSTISIREQLLIMIKLNFCCQVYQTLKKTKCNQQALYQYRKLIAEYLSQIIWMN
ncbi:unnamed protein product (macronuclear) [Paramecium tetraurelia]|uniref:Transmembrane protein n=1 Tax=Paramecium tetraurelia TaxID=5888 RepID=A0DBI0_PARTE|nr:uncharacterized protein GSPATT00015292001 [Paramecium tetraurelia]CAK80397.1 unnamed protein product [Paramecium tetraurelia]|eukprot:XP_001447794.1 hypothetical protein (macronuclear) [Paramecium tetraurelia strain d4-2]